MTQVYRTLRVAPSGKGVVGVVIDAPPASLEFLATCLWAR